MLSREIWVKVLLFLANYLFLLAVVYIVMACSLTVYATALFLYWVIFSIIGLKKTQESIVYLLGIINEKIKE